MNNYSIISNFVSAGFSLLLCFSVFWKNFPQKLTVTTTAAAQHRDVIDDYGARRRWIIWVWTRKNIARFSVSELPIFFAASLKGHQASQPTQADLRNVTENYDLALASSLRVFQVYFGTNHLLLFKAQVIKVMKLTSRY